MSLFFARSLFVVGLALGAGTFCARAQEGTVGTVTKLPLPRFVSLKPSDTPMREGPGKDHRIKWVFKREGLPVEVIGESDQWRRVRDSESTDGWVYYGRLSNRRTALITGAGKVTTRPMYAEARESAAVVAQLQPGVIANVSTCAPAWCKLHGPGFEGWMKKDALWGVYPDEAFN